MPELPEVETVKSALEPIVTGQTIRTLRLARADLRWPMPEGLATLVEGRRMGRPLRRGKYILLPVDGVGALLIHLGMSGAIRIHHTKPEFGKHDHVAMEVSTGAVLPGALATGSAALIDTQSPNGQITKHDSINRKTDTETSAAAGQQASCWWVFSDPRRFGHLDLISDYDAAGGYAENTHWLLDGMGPEPLSNQFDAVYLSQALKQRSMPIKTLLLDQKIVAGIGNIYACEALFRAGISPKRKAATVAGKRAERLVPAIQSVLRDAISQGGTSLRDHVQPGGEIGYFVQSLSVYGRAGEACFTCQAEIKQIRQSGRSSFYCSSCQR